MRHTESRLQSECVRYFRLAHPSIALLFFSVPNGVCTSASQGRILKAEGMVAGVADALLLVPSGDAHGLAVEFKQSTYVCKAGRVTAQKTYQRPEQREWQAAVEAQGYRYAVVRSFDEFRSLVDGYLEDK